MQNIRRAVRQSVVAGSDAIRKMTAPTPSVFGAAPSLSHMLKLNAMSGNKKVLFRAPEFWYYFRVYYPYIFSLFFCVFMTIALCGWNTVAGHLILGSILSILSSLAVVASYFCIVPWRKHPSGLILYRAICSMVFSFNILLNVASRINSRSCATFGFVTQLMLMAGECWLTTIALDLVFSLTNPFTSYRYNLKRYQMMVWSFAFTLSYAFFLDTPCQSDFHSDVCWVNVSDGASSGCLWGYFFIWILLMYLFQIGSAIFASNRLRKGVSATFEVRKKCAMETFKCLTIYAAYIFFLILCFVVVSSNDKTSYPREGTAAYNFGMVFLFLAASRGSVDGVVWFILHDFMRDEDHRSIGHEFVTFYQYLKLHFVDNFNKQVFKPVDEEGAVEMEAGESPRNRSGSLRSRGYSRSSSTDDVLMAVARVSSTIGEIADLAIAEFDEADLSPQVNMALRQQIVQYVTSGVRDSVYCQNITHLTPSIYKRLKMLLGIALDLASVPGIPEVEFLIDKQHPFKTFAPELFRELRQAVGIEDEVFIETLSSTANERLSEGASGAFMFFCGGGEFIVKTIRDREARVLHEMLPDYAEYIKENPNSLLCRFLGSYSLKMYAQTFYFVVMLNCFEPKAEIHERFDIKGSWVNRSAAPVQPNKKVVCRHCNDFFTPAAKEKCKAIVGYHEANVVLKDNDLRIKISLDREDASNVVDILMKDSELLRRMGVLDYSLLLAVNKRKFIVDADAEHTSMAISGAQKAQKTPTKGKKEKAPKKSLTGSNGTFKAQTVTGPAVYYLGIVDFLQDWSTQKKMERAFKIYVGRNDPEGLSVHNPDAYSARFQGKMCEIFDVTPMDGIVTAPQPPAPVPDPSTISVSKLFSSVQERKNSIQGTRNPLHGSGTPILQDVNRESTKETSKSVATEEKDDTAVYSVIHQQAR